MCRRDVGADRDTAGRELVTLCRCRDSAHRAQLRPPKPPCTLPRCDVKFVVHNQIRACAA